MWQGLYLSNGDREGTINVGSAPDIFFSVKFDTSSPLFSPLSHVFKQVLSVWQIALPMSIKNTRHSDLWIKGIGFFLTRMQPVAGVMQLETAPYLRNGTHTHKSLSSILDQKRVRFQRCFQLPWLWMARCSWDDSACATWGCLLASLCARLLVH